MNQNPLAVISVEGISKKFCANLRRSLYYGTVDVVKSMLGGTCDTENLRADEFWALRDVSFEVAKGEMLGIIGQNGSGKSTLLRMLSGIYPPDKGTISVRGRIGALISVGAGFHPHMTGRENIYLNGTILGMDKEAIAKNLENIIEFAEIGKFIDSPVSTYSSGMTVRLGFAIAVYSFPEVLVADEVLSVGDLQFTLKCYRKLSEYKKNGGTLILVSHSVQQVRNFCTKVLWIDRSQAKMYGDTQTVCDAYEAFMLNKDAASEAHEDFGKNVILNYDPETKIPKVCFLNEKEEEKASFVTGSFFKARLFYDFKRIVRKPIFTVSIFNLENIQIVSNYTVFDKFQIDSLSGTGFLDFEIPVLNLKPSRYKFMVTLADQGDINNILEWHDRTYSFTVDAGNNVFYGLVNPAHRWTLG